MACVILGFAAGVGAILWIVILLLPWKPWSTAESLDVEPTPDRNLSDVTVLIPARDEADVIAQTLESLNRQGEKLNVILVDDQSSDGTAEVAQKAATNISLQIVKGSPLPEGWAGKLWALEQGRKHVQTQYLLLMDADIELENGILPTLKHFLIRREFDFVSLMAHLKMKTFWEKALIPSFIYFFKLLYPFALANSPRTRRGVAAGGCIFLKTKVLQDLNGFESLRGALIDDCTLAAKVKGSGARTWMGLTHSVTSHREYADLKSIWNMVARSAFTQLQYSKRLLVLCSVVMISMFILPPLGIFVSASQSLRGICLAGTFAMAAGYMPTLRYYGRSTLWIFFLPIIGGLYLAMTWTSAIRYWRGRRSEWKGRVYSK